MIQHSERSRAPNIALFSFPYPSPARLVLLMSLVSLLAPLCNRLYIVSAIDSSYLAKLRTYVPKNNQGRVYVVNIPKKLPRLSIFSVKYVHNWISSYISIQVMFFAYSIKLINRVDIAFFFVGIRDFIPLMIYMKLHGVKIVWY